MQVTYLFHSGFMVETALCYYIFDYWKGSLPALRTDKPVMVFVSHSHADHYNPQIFSMLLDMGVKQITAVLAKDIRQRNYPPRREELVLVRAYHSKEYELACGTHVQTLLSTDSGVAYLISCPEGTIYHAGDLNDWNNPETSLQERKQMTGSYRASLKKIIQKNIDIAFLPLDPRLGECYADGFIYFLKNFDVKEAYPMHYWEEPEIIGRFLTEYPRFAETVKNTEACLHPA